MIRASPVISPQLNGQLLPNQKVRTTCNACQQAKIRCSHTHPCDRCVSHGFECVYSISQPLGRPAKKKSRPTPGLQVGRTEGKEGVGRSLRRGAFGDVPRLSTGGRRQRFPRKQVRTESNPEEKGESHRGDSGTEVTDCETDLKLPGGILVSEVQGECNSYPNGSKREWTDDHRNCAESLPSGDRIQDQQTVSADEANHAGPGTNDQSLGTRCPFETPQDWEGGFDFQKYSHLSQLKFNSFTVPSTPLIGLMVDEEPPSQFGDGEPSSLHEAALGFIPGLLFEDHAPYHFCLAPNARHISGTIHHPWRIMELPSNEERQGQLDTCSSQSPSPEEIDREYLSADSISTRCSCCR